MRARVVVLLLLRIVFSANKRLKEKLQSLAIVPNLEV